MARNTKPAYINKIRAIEAPNGYKFDIANYLYNPAFSYDYPSFYKVIESDETTETVRRVYYFKHYDGSGEYIAETYKRNKNGNGWQVTTGSTEEILEKSNRYNVKKLLTFCN